MSSLGITLRHAFLGASVLLLVVGCGSASDEETSSVRHSIVGGQRSLEFPAVGALVVANEYLCTGTLVAPNIVLTAAHCFADFYRDELVQDPKVWFFTGTIGSGPPFRAKRVVVAPDTRCLFTTTGRDLAYVVLARPVEGVEPLEIAREPHEEGCDYRAVGYGSTVTVQTTPDNTDPAKVTEPLCADVAVRPADKPKPIADEPLTPERERKILASCAEKGLNATGMIRVRSAEGSTCIGDSGGPLIDPRTRRIVAVVSAGVIDDQGVTCGTNSGARYTPVDGHRDFVDEAVAAGEKAEAEEESGGCNATSSRTTRSDSSSRADSPALPSSGFDAEIAERNAIGPT